RRAAAGGRARPRRAARLRVSRQGVVKHLQVLQTAGLVEAARTGRKLLYSVRPDPPDASARWLAEMSAAWDRRLAAIKPPHPWPSGGSVAVSGPACLVQARRNIRSVLR